MKKQILKSGFFLKCLMVLLAIGWSTSSVQADNTWWRLRVIAIHRDGTPANSYVAAFGNEEAVPTPTTNDSTMQTPSNGYNKYQKKAAVCLAKQARNGEIFQGLYKEAACTTLLADALTYVWYAANSDVPLYATSAEAAQEAHLVTVYALFSDPVDWGAGDTPPTTGEYYIYNIGRGGFIIPPAASWTGSNMALKWTSVANDAALFTLSYGVTDPTKTIISIDINNGKNDGTWYLKRLGDYFAKDLPAKENIIEAVNNAYCQLKLDNGKYWESNYLGTLGGQSSIAPATNIPTIDYYKWLFISKQAFLNNCKVKSKNSDGSVLIDSPTGEGTAYVSFNVSELGNVSDFEYSLSNTENWEIVDTTRNGNVITLGVKYSAQGVGDFSTTIVTMFSKAKSPATVTSATATASAAVSFTPVCEMAVGSKLDWSYDGEELKETFNAGMEVAASQRTRLKNQLVYNGDNAIVRDVATWTATITGTNADQFKFSNGEQEISGTYSPELLDVIYAPTAAGTHTATLRVVVSYTTATSEPVEVTLSGKAQNVSAVTMAVNGATASNNASLNLGDIIGTNSQDVTVVLYIQGMSNLTKEWSAPAGTFEFDENSLDLLKANQTLTFRAHRSTAVSETTNHMGTLTIKSNGTTVGTLILTYTAKPLLTPEVTWNWALLNEDATYSNPLSIISDGEWTLEQKDGNGGMTYNATDKTITTEYMHHESGYQAKFELNIAQTATYAAYRDTTLVATISAVIPPTIEINSAAKLAEYGEGNFDHISYIAESNAVNVSADVVYFKWSGQSTLSFKYEVPGYPSHGGQIYEIYEDDTEREIYNDKFYTDSTHLFSVSPAAKKIKIDGGNKFKNVRYFEYDTIDVNYHGVTFVENGATTRDITATFANKRAVTVSLNVAAQPYFELRAEGKPTGSTLVYDSADGLAVHKFVKGKVFTVAIKDGVNYADAKAAAVNGFQVILQDNFTYNSEVVVLPIALEEEYTVTYKRDANGSYKVTYHDDLEHPHTVSTSADYEHTVLSIVETSCTATLSEPTPASGYMFRGWKLNGELASCKAPYTVIPGNGATVEPVFVPVEEAVYGIDDARFADLDEALSTAGSIADTKPVVVLLKDVTLSEAATHTIPAGVTLLIPYKADFNELQVTPEITTTATPLSAYRTLTLKEGVNIVCNGTICVSAKIMAAGGGNKSAYTTGECGVINMVDGGHIELNNGAHLYCWGYIKGQDMDQGNNTVGTGTITVNAGAVVHENFELGDWRGGTASSNIYFEKDDKHLFPFQSYALQNVEIPTTYTYGSKLETFIVVNTGFGSVPFVVSMIGSEQTLFLLKNAGSVIRKWYDPTTDLCCYELSGTAQLDELTMNLPFVGEFQSGSCNLPVSNSMHIILADCNMTLSKPLTIQAGAVVEIKPTATINLTAKIHMFDKDEWGLYIHNYYFRSFNNLTSHKNRGAENSKEGLEDAKFIIDGTLNVKSGQGYIYSTAGGANLMGNGGGKIVFEGALPTEGELWQVTVLGQKPYITWVPTNEAAANLCNEDGSYTKSLGFATFYNIHGRWFETEDAVESSDHTYWFRYLDNGNTGEDVGTNAVYSHDKTGLEARMKWFNVVRTADNCTDVEDDLDKPFTSNWWLGTNPTAYYNYTMLGEWHQFMETETTNVYSASNNVLYRKAGCDWAEDGYIDENCLYTFGDVKKALVDGHFIPLTSNGYDPAYHQTDDASKYFICFTGCNWHPATPYTGESKAYTIHPEDEDLYYIWFNNDWMNVLRDEPFFYTEDEQTNVRTYYEYINGEWEIATPYVSVRDAAETRTFYMIKEAFNVAQIKKNATITLLRDIPNVAEVLTYSTQNTTCTLDLNGHSLSGNIVNLITVNAPGATFTITDNAELKIGKIGNTANKAVYVQKGTLVVANGTIESAGAYAIDGASGTTITINGGYFAADTKCVQTAGSCAISGGHFTKEAGLATYAAAHKYPFETADPKYQWEVSDAWTITFKNGETALQTLHLKPGEMPVYTANEPTKDNQHFTGWDPAIAAATADVTYQAQFEAIGENKSRVTLNSNGGNEGLQYVYVTTGSAIGSVPAGTTKDGHTFTGWFTAASGGTQITTATTVSADVIWYAHYTKNSYTLTWDANGGQLSGSYTSGSVQYGAAITAPTATMAGHTCLGWNATPAATMPAHDVTYTAQWSVLVKHYQQNLDGSYPASPTETKEASGEAGEYVTPAAKTYDGFITPATQTVQIGVNIEVTYQYARREYTIILDANGGECATASLNIQHGATPTLPDATKEGYTFDGWFTKAVGGDQITNETVILRNIGTLYAHFTENVTLETVIIAGHGENVTVTEPDMEANALVIEKDGMVTFASGSHLTVQRLILESTGNLSGQLLGLTSTNLEVTDDVFFDFIPNGETGTQARTWYAIAVPWEVDAENGIFWKEGNRRLVLGQDFDLIYYDGATRASQGNKPTCWKYVQHDANKTMHPGQLYMMYFDPGWKTIRFAKKSGRPIIASAPDVAHYDASTGQATDANWNGIANPMVFHAFLNAPGISYAQVLNNGSLDDYLTRNEMNPVYKTIAFSSYKFVVGKPVFVQATSDQSVVVTPAVSPSLAPRRIRAAGVPEGVEAVYQLTVAAEDRPSTDNLFIQTAEEKADAYVIGKDLAKGGVAKNNAQLWVNRYGVKLSVNTVAAVNGVHEYPLGLSIPAAGEYTIAIESAMGATEDMYLTRNGEAIWNLSNGAYTGSFEKGTTSEYGLRVSAKSPQIATGLDEAVVDAKGETRKVMINDKVFIIRGENVYSVDGQLVK